MKDNNFNYYNFLIDEFFVNLFDSSGHHAAPPADAIDDDDDDDDELDIFEEYEMFNLDYSCLIFLSLICT